MSIVVTDQRHKVALVKWMEASFGDPEVYYDPDDFFTIALIEPSDPMQESDVLVVTGLHHWTAHTVQGTIAVQGQRCTRAYVYAVFDHIFNAMNRTRFITHVAADNHKSIKLQKQLGLSVVGRLADFYGEGLDALELGITKSEWMKGPWAKPPVCK